MESGLLRDGAQERLVDGCYLLPEEPGLGGQSERAIAYASSILAILTERHGQYQRAIALNEETLARFGKWKISVAAPLRSKTRPRRRKHKKIMIGSHNDSSKVWRCSMNAKTSHVV